MYQWDIDFLLGRLSLSLLLLLFRPIHFEAGPF